MTNATDIINLLHQFKPEIAFEPDTDLFDSGLIDSLTIFSELLPRLMQTYQLEVSPLDLSPDNFSSPQAIAAYVNRTKEAHS